MNAKSLLTALLFVLTGNHGVAIPRYRHREIAVRCQTVKLQRNIWSTEKKCLFLQP